MLGVLGLIVVVAVVWRLASRRRSLPCPVWLRWLVELDNPFARANRSAVIVEHLDLRPGMTVLGEIPDREVALKEIFNALKPGGILSVTEIVFDPHFQSRNTVRRLVESAGFRENEFFGNRFAFTLNLERPENG